MNPSRPSSRRVLMIGLDAAEPRLIERWTDDGSLPTLRRLREQGLYGRLDSSAAYLAGSPWPTFFTSRTPAEHGLYNYLAWRPRQMASIRPTADYLPITPFWHDLSGQGPRVIAIDVPLTYQPAPFNGLEVSNWATHEALVPAATYPAALMDELRSKFGPPQRTNEEYGLLPLERLLKVGDEQCALTDGLSSVAATLMGRDPWDLFLIVFTATHRSGHKLWDRTGLDGEVPKDREVEFDDALRQVYISVDRAVQRLLQTAGDGVTTIVFSLHGMGENTCRADLLPEMLARVLAGGSPATAAAAGRSPLKRLRQMIPGRWRNAVKDRLPLALQDRLTSFWRVGRTEWSSTRAFCLVADLQGYIRFNVRGRETEGIVAPGVEYDRLCEEIAAGLHSFRDADGGEPVVSDVVRSDQLYPEGAHRDLLPDLIVRWSTTPAAPQRQVVSPRFGSIDLERPGKNLSGRSGNHRPHGFVLAAGEGLRTGELEQGNIMDLVPTVYELFGLTPPAQMRGRALQLGAKVGALSARP